MREGSGARRDCILWGGSPRPMIVGGSRTTGGDDAAAGQGVSRGPSLDLDDGGPSRSLWPCHRGFDDQMPLAIAVSPRSLAAAAIAVPSLALGVRNPCGLPSRKAAMTQLRPAFLPGAFCLKGDGPPCPARAHQTSQMPSRTEWPRRGDDSSNLGLEYWPTQPRWEILYAYASMPESHNGRASPRTRPR